MAKYFGSKILQPGAKRKDVRILNYSTAKYFGSKILTPGAKRKDVRILNLLWQNNLDQKFSHLERSVRM